MTENYSKILFFILARFTNFILYRITIDLTQADTLFHDSPINEI